MKMSHLLSVGEARKGLSDPSVGLVCGHDTDNLSAVVVDNEDGTTADPVDCNAINDVGLPKLLAGTYAAREKAERVRLNSGKSKPPSLPADVDRSSDWQQWYGRLWKLKIALQEKDHR